MKTLKNILLALLAGLAIASCSKKDDIIAPPATVNEEEVITTVRLVLTPTVNPTAGVVTMQSSDNDGNGQNPPVITFSGSLAINKTYNGEVFVLNELVLPAKNISAEILAEAADHQFFYKNTGTLPMFNYAPITIAPDNYDTNGKPVGFKTVFATGAAASTGSLTITLRHQGNKTLAGVAAGDITNATGETDFEVTFPGIIIQ